MTADSVPVVTIGLLGPLQVAVDGAPVAVGGRNPRLVLALLALDAGRVVSADRLADALWGEAAFDRSPTTLQVHVSNLRKSLGPAGSAVVAVTPGYRLDPDIADVDADAFERRVDEARAHATAGQAPAAVAALEEGLALWRGRALSDLEDVAELDVVRHRLEELRLLAVGARCQLLIDAGRHEELVPDLERLVAEHPFREAYLGQLMLVLYRSGRQADALQAYQAARERLGDQLGLEPAPELQKLERSILQHSPSVELDAVAEGPSLRWIDGDGHARRHPLVVDEPPIVIGREEPSPVCLDHDPAVSRRHARVEHEAGVWWVADGGWSTNGTFVNGRRVVDRTALADGDILRCGETALLVHLDPVSATRPKVDGGHETISLRDA